MPPNYRQSKDGPMLQWLTGGMVALLLVGILVAVVLVDHVVDAASLATRLCGSGAAFGVALCFFFRAPRFFRNGGERRFAWFALVAVCAGLVFCLGFTFNSTFLKVEERPLEARVTGSEPNPRGRCHNVFFYIPEFGEGELMVVLGPENKGRYEIGSKLRVLGRKGRLGYLVVSSISPESDFK